MSKASSKKCKMQ